MSTVLDIRGMTCASCANRIERKLNRLEGVTATVNYATEQAVVEHPDVPTEVLLETVAAAGYQAVLPTGHDEEELDARSLLLRLLVSAALALPVLLLSMVSSLQPQGWEWVAFGLTTPVVVWGGWPFHRAAWVNLRHGSTTMDTLVSLGTLAAYLWSVTVLLSGRAMESGMGLTVDRDAGAGQLYFEVSAAVTAFLLAGRYAEARSKRRSGAAIRALLSLGAKEVSVLRDGREQRVPVDQLAVGEQFLVRPGEKVATDGVVVAGASAVDSSLVTGESVPVEVGPGDAVIGGTVNASGVLTVRAERVGSDTQLAQIARLVAQAQTGKAAVQRLADRVSAVFVPVVLVLAALTLAGWLLAGQGAGTAITAAVAVLVIACPCALGLATPTALMVGTGRGAQLGILIKGPEVLESTRRIDTVVLDKTGTVTTGRMELLDVAGDPDGLRLAAAAEAGSEHPIARAIVTAGPDVAADVHGFQAAAGLGVRAVVDGRTVLVGRPAFLAAEGHPLPDALEPAVAGAQAAGRTAIAVGWDGAARAVLTVGDTVRETSSRAVQQLKDLGLRPVLLTGDNRAAAQQVATAVGIDEVIAEVLPEDKVATVRGLQDQGRVVAMVGDGVNDAAALAQADLGLAMGHGADAAIEAGDLTLVRDDLLLVPQGVRLARRTLQVIRGNLFWAFAYNVAALPLAVAGLLNPVIAGGAMAFSSVFVVANSLRLRAFR